MTDLKRADMHLHTSFSGWRRLHLIDARDCYVSPDAAFATARQRGMDFVCFTDHDTLDGALDFLSRHPEAEPHVILGEEVEVRFPGSPQWLHLNVYGLDERTHADLARTRADCFEAVTYLREKGLLFVLNHPFQSFRSIGAARRHLAALLPLLPAIEVCNSTSPRSHRPVLEAMLLRGGSFPRAWVGGSDAHTARRIAAAYTTAPGASKQEFLDSIRQGRCTIGGDALGVPALIRDVYQIIGEYYRTTSGSLLPTGEGLDLSNILGSVALLPPVLVGLPAVLAALHMARQEWIARGGSWARESRAWVASKTACPVTLLMFPPGAMPMPPTWAARTSDA